MDLLYHRNINSLMVEGGAFALNEFINCNLFDEIHRFKSKKIHLESGVLAPNLLGKQVAFQELTNDFYEVYKKNTQS